MTMGTPSGIGPEKVFAAGMVAIPADAKLPASGAPAGGALETSVVA